MLMATVIGAILEASSEHVLLIQCHIQITVLVRRFS